MKNKRIIILCITAIVLIVTGLLYFSYGYYMTNITGTENSKKLTSLTKIFKFEFSDGTENLVSSNTNFIPGSVIEKTFTITNKSTEGVYFNIDLDDVTNTFSRTSDIIYEVHYNSEIISTNIFPTTNSSIATNLYIEKDGTRTYTLKVKYLDSEENQISDMGKSISASVTFSRTDNPITKFNILGNSYQSIGTGKNLLVYPYVETTKTENGITFTDLGNGEILLNGTATKNTIFSLYTDSNPLSLEAGSYVLSGVTNGSSNTYYLQMYNLTSNTSIPFQYNTTRNFTVDQTSQFRLQLVVTNGVSVDNAVIKPQVEIGTNGSTYEKYGVSPTPSNPSKIFYLGEKNIVDNKYKIELKTIGKNIFNFNKVSQQGHISKKTFSTTLNDGTVKEEYGYYAKGYSGIYLNTSETLEYYIGKKVTISFDLITGEDGDFLIYQYQANGIGIQFPTTTVSMKANETNRIELTGEVKSLQTDTVTRYSRGEIIVYKKDYISTYTIKNIQFEFGSNATDYEPYEEKNYDVYLDEPLRCANNVCDYIDVLNKKLVRNVKNKIFDGIETWSEYTTVGNHYQIVVGDNSFGNTINNVSSNYYLPNKKNGTYFSDNDYAVLSVDGNRIRFKDKDISTLDDWVSRVKEFKNNGTPLEVNYQLKTPTESYISLPDITDITSRTLVVTDGYLNSSSVEIE